MIQVAEATIEKRVVCTLVTRGISQEKIGKAGLGYASDAQSALGDAFNRLGKAARIAVLRHAAEMLPIITNEEFNR